MFFKVDYDKVSEVGHSLITKAEELDSLYLKVIDLCNLINDNWQSEDSTIYLSQFAKFIKEKLRENQRIGETGNVLKKVSSRYSDQDNKWAKDLIKSDILKGNVKHYE